MAKDLVRTRRYISKFYTMKTQLQAVSLRIQGMRSNQQMAEAMKGATKVRLSLRPCRSDGFRMQSSCLLLRDATDLLLLALVLTNTRDPLQAMSLMSRQMNLPQIQRILQDFEKESSMMDMKEEMMGDAIDDAMDDELGETEEEEGDRILDEVLAEIGVSVGQQVRPLPMPLSLATIPLCETLCCRRIAIHASLALISQLGEAPTSVPATALSEPGVRRAVAVGETSGGGHSTSSFGGAGGAGPAGGDGGLEDLQARLDNLRKD